MADGHRGHPGRCDIAIVGMAALFPGSADLSRFWGNIVAGVDSVTQVPDTRWDPSYYDAGAWDLPASDRFYCRRGGFIDDIASFDPARFGIMPVAVEGAEPDQLLALATAADAIVDAGGEARLGDRTKVGVIVGRGGYITPGIARLDQRLRAGRQLEASLRELVPGLGEDQLERVRRDFMERLGPERPEASIGLVPNLAASRIANRLDLQGPAYTVDAACASSLVAVDQAVGELTSGRCDTVIAGGVHVCHDVTLWSVFSQLRALSPSQHIRPFDRRADGILIGEGIGMVVLKRLADAERAGDRVYAVIRGVGVASDGRDSSLMRPRVEGQVLALTRAWRAAGLDPQAAGAVGLIEAHGTATVVGDEAELTTLGRVFGPGDGTAGSGIGIGSVKSMIGHAMPAAGMAGLIKAALAVHHRVLPPTLHCEEPHPALEGGRLRPIVSTESWDVEGSGVRRAAVNAFGFGGINAHVIVEEARSARDRRAPGFPALPVPVVETRDRVLLMAGRDLADVARQLEADDADLLARDDLGRAPAGGPCRLAIVDPTPTKLKLARRLAAGGRPWRGRNDVWFTTEPLLAGAGAGKVAFVFPGIEQAFEPRVEGVAAHFGLFDPRIDGTGTLGRHAVGTVLIGRLLDGALRGLGIRPDLVAGHSIGEWNAMISAGMYDAANVDAFIENFDEDKVVVPGVVFAALGCGADQAAAAIAGLGRIVVSHDNCPNQSIVCGEEASVAAALRRLRADGVGGQVLTFRSGFHTPMLEPYLGPVGDLLTGLTLLPARVPVWSATTVAPYPADLDSVRPLLVRHLLETVRFGPLVRRLHDEGVRAFIQVGSGSLTGFISDTLRDRDHLVVAATTAKRRGLDQLRRVAAALWVEGGSPRLEALATGKMPLNGEPVPADTTDGRTHRGRVVRLNLGSPIVHFAAAAVPLTVAPAAAAAAAASGPNPLLSEFDAVLADATEAAEAVLRSWNAAPPVAVAPVAVAPVAHVVLGPVTTTRVLSVETMPYLLDHCFYRQPEGWPDDADRFPVVPMTTMLEMMMEAAGPLAGGRTITGISRVRAMRWLAVPSPVTLTITAALDADGHVDVTLEGYARGKVMLADGYPSAPAPSDEGIGAERPAGVSGRQLYEDRWMFHGPQFQGVAEIGALGETGIRGELRGLPAPGGLLDNAGQLFGFWLMTHVEVDKLALPAAIGQVRYFGPAPAPGEIVGCTVWIRTNTDTKLVADLELRNADGSVWARIDGWEDRRFASDSVVWPMLLWPETHRIAEEQPGGWFLLRDRWTDVANRELIMRRYLTSAEREEYEAKSPRARHPWLLGRIAVKDALRQRLWDGGAGPLFPAEFAVGNDAAGKPFVEGRLDAPVHVSIAHKGPVAVAIVRDGGGVGIDVEAVEDRSQSFEAMVFTDAERAMLDGRSQGDGRREWSTRFWCAKEAVAKSAGTGLGGLPRRFEIQEVDGERVLVVTADGAAHWVETTSLDHLLGGAPSYVAAWTPGELALLNTAAVTNERTTDER